MQSNTAEIDRDEYPGILPRFQPAERLVKAEDDVLEGEVDASGEEGRCEDDRDNLSLVCAVVPGILVLFLLLAKPFALSLRVAS